MAPELGTREQRQAAEILRKAGACLAPGELDSPSLMSFARRKTSVPVALPCRPWAQCVLPFTCGDCTHDHLDQTSSSPMKPLSFASRL